MKISIISALVLSYSLIAHAQLVTNSVPIPVIGCPSQSQLCATIYEIPVVTRSTLMVQYDTGPAHCSPVRMHFLLDGREVAVSDWLDTVDRTGYVNLGRVGAGAHTIGLQLEGMTGGCNQGSLGSWAGTADIVTDAVAPDAPLLMIDFSAGLRVTSPIGTTNRIEYATDLASTNWLTLTNIVITESPQIISDRDFALRTQRFYRVVSP